jgi:hypothetical protein
MSNYLLNIFNTGEIVSTRVMKNEAGALSVWNAYYSNLLEGCNGPYQQSVSSYSITPTTAEVPS